MYGSVVSRVMQIKVWCYILDSIPWNHLEIAAILKNRTLYGQKFVGIWSIIMFLLDIPIQIVSAIDLLQTHDHRDVSHNSGWQKYH